MHRFAFGLFALAAFAAPLRLKIDRMIESSPAARQAFWGIQVVDLRNGATVYERNADKFFIPASNTKLYSTALAFTRLGPAHRFRTTVAREGSDLVLIGGGDPNLSERVIPYEHKKVTGRPLAALESLADQLAARGITRIDGDVIGDDTLYPYEPYPEGWGADDPVYEYGAPVSALTLNDNAFKLHVERGELGGPARLLLKPAVEHLIVHNRTRTVASTAASLSFERLPGSRELVVRGEVGASKEYILGVDDPALFAASALLDVLRSRGIEVRGSARARHRTVEEPRPGERAAVATHESPPLAEALRVVNKVSQNLHAELMLRAVSADGSRKAGLEQLAAFLKEIGVAEKHYNFEDGSGLSRLTLVTPRSTATLLRYLFSSPHREAWLATLPVGGVDGTLAERFEKEPAGRNVLAKTGSLTHVAALAGYTLRNGKPRYAFVVMTNNFNVPARDIRQVIDKIAVAIAAGE